MSATEPGMGYPSSALSCCMGPHGRGFHTKVAPVEEQHLAAKIARAMASGPRQVMKDATVAEWNHDGTYNVLRQGTNDWVCFPGNENEIGNVPMCCDPMGLQYVKDYLEGKHAPTNTSPGLIYMLCGATQHSNVDAFDKTSPPIPIRPHWMILWPYDSARDGLPNTGAWVMFDKTPYAYLHICGNPWEGNEYDPDNTTAIWTMQYGSSTK